jgi:hypothetical protein
MMNDDLYIISEEAVVAEYMCYPDICLEGLKTHKKPPQSEQPVLRLRFEPKTTEILM